MQNRQPDPECYVLMADAAVEAKDKSKAAKYIAHAKKHGLDVTATALAFVENGRQR